MYQGGNPPPDTKKHFSQIRRTIWSPERFCRFDFGKKNPAGAQYNRQSTVPAHNCFALQWPVFPMGGEEYILWSHYYPRATLRAPARTGKSLALFSDSTETNWQRQTASVAGQPRLHTDVGRMTLAAVQLCLCNSLF